MANTLLAVVVKRISAPIEKDLAAQERVSELEYELETVRSECEGHKTTNALLENNLRVFQAELDRRPKRGSTPLRDRLSDQEKDTLDSLMRSLPSGK